MTEQERKSKEYRDYRQSCGIVDPIMLDEIEEAYYACMENITMTNQEKLEEAKRLYKTANADQRYVLERLFPELKDSDEKIVMLTKELNAFRQKPGIHTMLDLAQYFYELGYTEYQRKENKL